MVDLQSPADPSPVLTDVLSQVFDFDDIYYFVAPDWWAPRIAMIPGSDIVITPPSARQEFGPNPAPSSGKTLDTWAADWGVNSSYYYITEDSEPAPLGASIGRLVEL